MSPPASLIWMEADNDLDSALATGLARLDELYGRVKAAWPGFADRQGQYRMMRSVLRTLLQARDPDEPADGSNLLAVSAGTGTGKTLGYCLPAIIAAQILQKPCVVSTATLVLQQQLLDEDLPRLQALIPDMTFAVLKGRGRYVCASRLAAAAQVGDQLDLDPAEHQLHAPAQHREWAVRLHRDLQAGRWNGEVDALPSPPSDDAWRSVRADANACHATQCANFRTCAFFKARREAAGATVQVANHALVLSALGADSPMLDAPSTLFIFDEAHSLPDIAAEQYAETARLGQIAGALRAGLADVQRASKLLPAGDRAPATDGAARMRECAETLRSVLDQWLEGDVVSQERPVYRFKHGNVPQELLTLCDALTKTAVAGVESLQLIAAALRAPVEEMDPKQRERLAAAAAKLAGPVSALQLVARVSEGWSTQSRIPLAKWIELVDDGSGIDLAMCCSPITAAPALARGLWSKVGAAVCMSATLTTCGSFDFFDKLSGLNRFPQRAAEVVESPFDYERQGEIRVPPMKASPKQGAAFTRELCATLPTLLQQFQHGQLVLFASKRELEACYSALPEHLQRLVLKQGSRSKAELLRVHRERVLLGQASILWGLDSFGTGLDLPGRECEHVVIGKLPFRPPTHPVEEALADWLESERRDPFTEIALQRAAMTLAQWTGRLIRTVKDAGKITICDTRLISTRYGAQLLAGLPPYPLTRLAATDPLPKLR